MVYFQTFEKSNHEEIPTRKSIFQKTQRALLKKLQKTKKLFQQTLQKRKEKLFNKLNASFVFDNKLFCKSLKPSFSNIKLVEGDKLRQDDSEVEKELNNFFKEAVLKKYYN